MHLRTAIPAALALTGALTLAGCAAPVAAPPPTGSAMTDTDLLSAHDLTGLDAEQIIERLDTMPVAERPTDLLASVQPEALVLSDDQEREARIPMPDDLVYISVAPYREQTHDCYFHSLTTCLGELTDTEVHLSLTTGDGEVLLDETRRTYDNGFIGIWVPRDTEATLKVEHDGRIGSTAISTTAPDDPTCITALQLI